MPEAVEQEAAQGHVLPLGQVDVQPVPYVVDAPPGLLSSLDIPTTLPRHVFD